MAERLFVGTRKGLFEFDMRGGAPEIVDVSFLGEPVSALLAHEGCVYAALDLGHFGTKLWRRDHAGAWHELAAPAFPPKPPMAEEDPHPWSLGKIWVLEPGGKSGCLWAGTMPGGLFVPTTGARRGRSTNRCGGCRSGGSGWGSPAVSSRASTRF